jgi:glycosyltransferase involved in cell wall biosynthesis
VVIDQPLIVFSLTREEYERLAANGPRRDIPLLAEKLGGRLLFRRSHGSARGLRGKLLGPHLRHAWASAGAARSDSTVFADGEHVGLPLAAFLWARRRRRVRLVVLGHYIDKSWKRALFRVATGLLPRGTLTLHSAMQAEAIRPLLKNGWELQLLPYQVDTDFWTGQFVETSRPVIVAAGSENRDYETLIEAVRGLDVDVRVASGSHWAREQASAPDLPANVQLIRETLSFAELRELYGSAAAVVVPLHPVRNQSGITTILEGMSMGKAVVLTATPGQREAVAGPLVQSDGSTVPQPDRGPELFGVSSTDRPTGLYVPPRDAMALRRAIEMLLSDETLRRDLGEAGRSVAVQHFSVERFAQRFAEVICRQRTGAAVTHQPEVPA